VTGIKADVFDLLGIGLIAAFAAWTVLSGVINDGTPFPQVALVATTGAGFVFGRVLGGRQPVQLAMAVALGILAAAVAGGTYAFVGGPLAPPLGYANANGALYAQGVAAAAIVASVASQTATRRLFGILALILFGMTVASGSLAATVLAAGILLAAWTVRWLGRWFSIVAPLAVIGAVAVTITVGLTHDAPAVPALEQALTERRAVLWQEAMEIFATQPVLGIGPGMFATTSPTALADPDARWAHSEPLQIAAETGIVGVLLLAALLSWTYVALWQSRQTPQVVVIGTAALTAFAVQATADYLLHFPALVITVAVLAGLASSRMIAEPENGIWPDA
jgi:O-antigen ligase